MSAKDLSSDHIPTLLQHISLLPQDKKIWDDAYVEEFFGLKNLPGWVSISESQLKQIKSKCKGFISSMAISTIKYDENGNPKRAKYRIVTLGNLDPHQWSKSECYAPVMSMMEPRLLTSLAVKHKRTLKLGNVKQAFMQAILPEDKIYVIRPPAGCLYTPPNTYWLLKRSLYGL